MQRSKTWIDWRHSMNRAKLHFNLAHININQESKYLQKTWQSLGHIFFSKVPLSSSELPFAGRKNGLVLPMMVPLKGNTSIGRFPENIFSKIFGTNNFVALFLESSNSFFWWAFDFCARKKSDQPRGWHPAVVRKSAVPEATSTSSGIGASVLRGEKGAAVVQFRAKNRWERVKWDKISHGPCL